MIYLDTGCLLKLYYPEPESARVAALVARAPIAFLGLHELELTNALALKRFRGEATAAQLRQVRQHVEDDVRGGVLVRVPLAWDDALADASTLAASRTHRIGCRSLDILHCAAARLLGASAFVTTDARQRKLATAMRLRCPRV